jgi:hypothetical protein
MKWMRLKIVTGVKSFSKPEQPQPKKSKFLSASFQAYIFGMIFDLTRSMVSILVRAPDV